MSSLRVKVEEHWTNDRKDINITITRLPMVDTRTVAYLTQFYQRLQDMSSELVWVFIEQNIIVLILSILLDSVAIVYSSLKMTLTVMSSIHLLSKHPLCICQTRKHSNMITKEEGATMLMSFWTLISCFMNETISSSVN